MVSFVINSYLISDSFGGGCPRIGNGLLPAWQACNTFNARLMSPFDSFTNESIASGAMFTCSCSTTKSTILLMSCSFSGENLNLVHRDSNAGDSLCV